MNEATSVPTRETEVSREFSKLRSITENLEELKKRFDARLEGVLNGGLAQGTDNAKNPENSSKFAQELNNVNGRLELVAKGLDGLLGRLEI